MKTFIQWASEGKKELPVYTQDESSKRSALAYWMAPDSASRSQYPSLYYTPTQSDALWKLGVTNGKERKVDRKAPPDNAP